MTKKEIEQAVKDGTLKIVNGKIVMEEEENGQEEQTQAPSEEVGNEQQTNNETNQREDEPATKGKNEVHMQAKGVTPNATQERKSPVAQANASDPRTQATPAEETWTSAFGYNGN